MHTPVFLYIATVLGAVSLVLILPKRSLNLPIVGAVLGAGTLAGLWLVLSRPLPASLGMSWGQFSYYYVFSGLAILSAVRVITHTRPVYSALWFVMVVLSSAGLLLTLDAQFIAFAMVIIYAGAILVTYLFVIMLASQQADSEEPADRPVYDRLAREPVAAVFCGFVLLAVLLNVSFPVGGMARNPDAKAMSDRDVIESRLTQRATPVLSGIDENATPASAAGVTAGASGVGVTNSERIGLDLFEGHPLGLELAGVILLLSLIGAVVIARTEVPGEDAPAPGSTPGSAPGSPPPGSPAPGNVAPAPTDEPGPNEDRGTGNVPESVSP